MKVMFNVKKNLQGIKRKKRKKLRRYVNRKGAKLVEVLKMKK
jgi:hypothetical protein